MPNWECLKHVFKHPWHQVSHASWTKYPTEDRPDILSVDMVERSFDPKTNLFTATRVSILKDKMPRFMCAIFGTHPVICLEHSVVDPVNKKMILKSQNISFRNVLRIEETCTYTVSPENENWTDFKQEAEVTAFPYGVRGPIENFMTDKFKTNAVSGREVMENAIISLKRDTQKGFEYLKNEAREVEEAFDDFVRSPVMFAEERKEGTDSASPSP